MAGMIVPIVFSGISGKGEESEGRRTRRARLKLRLQGAAKLLSAHLKLSAASRDLWRRAFENPKTEQWASMAPCSGADR